jgi:hypothetical protein
MFLIDMLNKHGGDYQKALGDISGYWGLAWTDMQALFLQTHNNTLALCKVGDVYYFSSDWKHLRAALGNVEYHGFAEGETMRFSLARGGRIDVANLPPLVNKAERYAWDARTQGRGWWWGSKAAEKSTADPFEVYDPDAEYAAIMGLKDRDPWNTLPDYEERWAEAWEEYVNEYRG